VIVGMVLVACAPGGTPAPPPESGSVITYGPGVQVLYRQNVAYGPDAQHRLDLWRRVDTTTSKVVLYVHGGFWQDQPYATRQQVPAEVTDLLLEGYAVATMSYRGINPEAGDQRHPEQIRDVKRAVSHLAANRAALGLGSGVSLVGFSAGGHLALMAAMTYGDAATTPAGVAETRVDSVVSIAGPTDLAALAALVDEAAVQRTIALNDYLCGSPLANPCWVTASASPVNRVSGDDPPTLLLYGSADTLVPATQGTVLANALGDASVTARFELVAGAVHTDIEEQLDTAALAAWLASPAI
jgi:acetyl esterase/lipase